MSSKNIEDVDLYALLDLQITATESEVCYFIIYIFLRL